MAELLGFDELDFIMKILDNRSAVTSEVRYIIKPRCLLNQILTFPSFLEMESARKVSVLLTSENQLKVVWSIFFCHHQPNPETVSHDVYSQARVRQRMEKQFKATAARPLFSGSAVRSVLRYPWWFSCLMNSLAGARCRDTPTCLFIKRHGPRKSRVAVWKQVHVTNRYRQE